MRRPRRDPWATSGLVTGITFVAAIAGAIRLANGPYPRPGTAAQEVRDYYRDSSVAARYSAAAHGLGPVAGPVHPVRGAPGPRHL